MNARRKLMAYESISGLLEQILLIAQNWDSEAKESYEKEKDKGGKLFEVLTESEKTAIAAIIARHQGKREAIDTAISALTDNGT